MKFKRLIQNEYFGKHMTCLSCVAILRESNGFSVVQRTHGKGKILKGRVEEEGFCFRIIFL
jgi:hypothetical protein